MPFDGITIRAVTKELHSELVNARIDKIHQPEKDEIILSIRQQGVGSIKLLISANARWARIHTTTSKKENPAIPPSFCMLLRKYLEGGKIREIKQVDFERIVHIRIEALDDFREWKDKLLICEFMGRHSNIILVNPENGLIIDAIKKYGSDLSSYREVLPGKRYKHPPSQGKLNPLEAHSEDFARAMWDQGENQTLASSLFNVYSGISPFSARESCITSGLDPDMPVEQAGEYELGRLYTCIKNLLEEIDRGKVEPVILYKNNEAIEFSPFYNFIPSMSSKYVQFSSMNAACDCYYKDKINKLKLESARTNLSRNIKSLLDKSYKKKFLQEGDIHKAKENEKYRHWGELLTSYAHQLGKGDKEAVLSDFYTGEQVIIKLDPRYTPIQNAQKYFKKYNKSRKALDHLAKLTAKTQEEIDYLESVMVAIKQAEYLDELNEIIEELEREGYIRERSRRLRSKQEKSAPRRFISSDGLEILAGKNNTQNDFLTLKQAKNHDLWLHAKDIPGTHVIVKLPKNIASIHDVPDSTLEEAAALAAYFSKASQSDKVPVDYTFIANVHKPSGAKPGMVIYENYWTIMANPHSKRLSNLFNSADIEPEAEK